MTVVENLGRLDIILALPDEMTRQESISNIRPTAADQDLHLVPNANLIAMYLKKLNQLLLF